MQHGKAYRNSRALFDREKEYSPVEAVKLLKELRREAQERLRRAASTAEQVGLLQSVQDLSRQIEDLERSLRDLAV